MRAGDQTEAVGLRDRADGLAVGVSELRAVDAATPLAFSVAAPMAFPSARKVTLPVGIPPFAEESFALMVRGWNCGTEADENVMTAFAVPVVTVTLRGAAVLLP